MGPSVYQFRIDWKNRFSLHNWIEQLDAYCLPKAYIGIIGAMAFFGLFLGSLVLPPLSDIYGRKPVFLYSLAL